MVHIGPKQAVEGPKLGLSWLETIYLHFICHSEHRTLWAFAPECLAPFFVIFAHYPLIYTPLPLGPAWLSSNS